MKNLENLNLQELSFEEQTNTDGGVVYSLIGNASSWLARQLNDFGRGFVEGFNGIMLQDLNLQELSFEETIQIDAGGETAYNIGKALGWSFQQIKDLGRGFIEGFSGI